MISLDGGTDTRYKMTIFYLCVRKFYADKFPPGTVFVLHMQNSHVQIDLRILNPHQIIPIIRRNADGHVHREHQPLINWSMMMAAAAGTAARAATGGG